MPKDIISSIRLKDIYKRYHTSRFTLRIDNLEFHNHSIHVVVGSNGSGKSTLLKLIASLEKPDKGNIFFNGRDALCNNGHDRLRKRIGFVMQNPYLFNIGVSENIALGLKIRRFPRDDILSKVNNIAEILNISHLAKRRVKNLSRGEYQKVAIAQVLVLEPDVILMDEPAANIDKESTLSIEETVKNIQKKSNSIVIMTTHSLTQAYRMSQDIVSIRDGRIVDFAHEDIFFKQLGKELNTGGHNVRI